MPFEDDFSNALREAADASEAPPVQLMATGAAQRGRRTKRRRTVLAATASVAVLAVAGTLAVKLGAPVTRPAPATNLSAAADSASPSRSAAQADVAAPKSMTGDQMLALFKTKLPSGLQLTRPLGQGTGSDSQSGIQEAMAGYTVVDSKGSGGVEITVTHQKADLNSAGMVCSPGWTNCTRTAQPDGSYLRLDLPPKAAGGEQLWAVQLQRPDGIVVTASSSDLPGPGQPMSPTPTRDAPVLTADQLKVIALDPVWLQVGAALAAPQDVPENQSAHPQWAGLPTDDILRIAAPLLPAGLTEKQITGAAKDDGFATFTVDDGSGASMVRLTVEDWSDFKQTRYSGPPIDTEFTDATVLPNGDKLNSGADNPAFNYKGVTRNWAQVLTPNHVMVLVEAFNGIDYKGDMITRSLPALTVDQVKAIAISPTWHGPAK
ncbi:hypothetical protein [Kitasatospora acidiphila]|uniref:hypothetical protein n=1 Tax=Kitasatospora acidiphila TaxID=2567942 RepID=UPI003C761903